MYSSSAGIPRHQQPTENFRRPSSQLQLQWNGRPASSSMSASVSSAKARSFHDENQPMTRSIAHPSQPGLPASRKPRPVSYPSKGAAVPSTAIPRRSSDKDATAIHKPSTARPPLSRVPSISSKALAEVTNLPSATQNRDVSLTTQRSTIRRPHSSMLQVTVQQPAPLSTTRSFSSSTYIGMKSQSATQHRITKSTAGPTTKIHANNSDTTRQKPNAPRPLAVTSSRSSWLKTTPPSSTFPSSAKPPASTSTNAIKQPRSLQQTDIRRGQKPPPAPRPPPGVRQQTMVRPPRPVHHASAEAILLQRSNRTQFSRLSIDKDQDVTMETPNLATRVIATAAAAKSSVSTVSSKASVSSTTSTTTTSTVRSGLRIPVPQQHRQRRGPTAPSTPAMTVAPSGRTPAPRKREPIIPAVPNFDSEMFMDVDVEMIDKDAQDRHRCTVTDTMSMEMSSEDTPRPEEYDDEYDPDPVFVSEYQADIFAYKRELEIKLMPDPDFMDRQPELTWHYRVHLIEWLIQVHSRFSLLQETLHLCVNYLDRYLSRKIIKVDDMQLSGLVALLLASKYEEIQSPSIKVLVELASNKYTAAQVRSTEVEMLQVLQYDLGHPGPMSFLRRISRVDDYDVDLRTLSKYLIDVTLCDHRFVVVPSSMVATLAYRTSMLLLDRKASWTSQHERASGYAESTLVAGVNVLLTMLERPELTHPVLFEMYQDPALLHASTYVHKLGVEWLWSLHL
ncbi:hypothetical protein BGZ73_003352 [Actinomortierella ambigua]|nr:hypothetical protein BGZ73_003352 [Actinomortierella ambigua]